MRLSFAAAALLVLSSSALATEPPLPPLPPSAGGSSAGAPSAADLPQTGDFQLFLNAPPVVSAFETGSGFGAETVGFGQRGLSGVSFAGLTSVGLGLNAGLGYCFTDLLEGGIALAIDYTSLSPGSVFAFGAEPFVKANLGRMLTTSGHWNPFLELGLVLGDFAATGVLGGAGSTGLVGFDLDIGAEFLVTRTWGITVYLPITLLDATNEGAASFGFGLGYGFAAYF
ncbi:MAG: hypothetical protein ACYCWW_12125 [Deltaproteobacteria bacterium]